MTEVITKDLAFSLFFSEGLNVFWWKYYRECWETLIMWHYLLVPNILRLCGDFSFLFFFFTLKEDVDVADKALAAEVRDNMEPWRLRLVSEP